MPRVIPASLQTELDRAHTETHTTLRLDYINGETRFYATKNVTINSNVYTDNLIASDRLLTSFNTTVDRIVVRIANADTNIGDDVEMGWVHFADASVGRLYIAADGTQIHRELFTGSAVPASSSEAEVELEIVTELVAKGYVVGNWDLGNDCNLVFKSDACGYDGPLTTCNRKLRSLDGCLGRNRQHRFVGTPFPEVNLPDAPSTVDPPVEIINPNRCFAPGTPVQMSDGTSLAIEEVQVGDWVEAFDDYGRLVDAVVTHTHKTPLKKGEPMWELLFEGLTESIICKPTHRIFLGNGEFLEARNFEVGTEGYVYGNGRLNPQEAVRSMGLRTYPFRYVYNLTVDHYHTYIAGKVAVSNVKPFDEIDENF